MSTHYALFMTIDQAQSHAGMTSLSLLLIKHTNIENSNCLHRRGKRLKLPTWHCSSSTKCMRQFL